MENIIKGIKKYRLIFVVLLGIVLISSCATSGVLGFGDPLTTSSYVDNADEESGERISSNENQLKQMTQNLSELQADVESFKNIQSDLDEMPKEMLRQLVKALQSYLDMLEKE
ncbi:MAG: hypothetical protein PF693_00630 [Spirochaetia bacterium]|jgi:peptidoglycan hydrolase CwlO-like protein|nr:hypothetical protein [Spirochaetia bacterium]